MRMRIYQFIWWGLNGVLDSCPVSLRASGTGPFPVCVHAFTPIMCQDQHSGGDPRPAAPSEGCTRWEEARAVRAGPRARAPAAHYSCLHHQQHLTYWQFISKTFLLWSFKFCHHLLIPVSLQTVWYSACISKSSKKNKKNIVNHDRKSWLVLPSILKCCDSFVWEAGLHFIIFFIIFTLS